MHRVSADQEPTGHFLAHRYPVVVREDLLAAFQSAWKMIAEPGNWYSGEQRVSVAQETRNAWDCEICRDRNAALSPNSVEHRHTASNLLSSAAIDAIHRIATDASRLSKGWLDTVADQGVSDAHYIELLGIVVGIISIDAFHDALGVAHETLPEPLPGQPSNYRPPGARSHGAWVATVAPADVSPAEADMYGGAKQTGNVLSAMSLVPSSMALLKVLSEAQYLKAHEVANPASNGGRALNRMQIELLAGRVSSINECFY